MSHCNNPRCRDIDATPLYYHYDGEALAKKFGINAEEAYCLKCMELMRYLANKMDEKDGDSL